MIKFEPVINLGTLIQILVFVCTVAFAYTRFVHRLATMETKVNIMWSVLRKRLGISEEDEEFFGGHNHERRNL